jgi:hypothetical protein
VPHPSRFWRRVGYRAQHDRLWSVFAFVLAVALAFLFVIP